MAKKIMAVEENISTGPRYKWVVSFLLAITMALLGFATAWGVQTANAGNLEQMVQEQKTEIKVLDKRVDQHDVTFGEQKTLLIGIDSKLDDLKDLIKDHKHGN